MGSSWLQPLPWLTINPDGEPSSGKPSPAPRVCCRRRERPTCLVRIRQFYSEHPEASADRSPSTAFHRGSPPSQTGSPTSGEPNLGSQRPLPAPEEGPHATTTVGRFALGTRTLPVFDRHHRSFTMAHLHHWEVHGHALSRTQSSASNSHAGKPPHALLEPCRICSLWLTKLRASRRD